MAKHKENQPSSPGKMTIMLIQLEGNDATLQEGIRTFKEAMGRAMPQMASRPQLPQMSAGVLPAFPAESNGDVHSSEEVREYVTDAVVVDPPISAPSSATKPARDRKFPVMEFVTDLNLHPPGKNSLKQFVEGKKPTNQLETITVCLYYLCRTLTLKSVKAKHIYTCLKDIGKRTPNDLPHAIRIIAKRKGFIDASNGDDLKITNPGENFVEHVLPKGITKS